VDAACAPSPSPSISTFVIFSSPSERSRLCRNSSRPPKRSEFLLSWDSPACAPLPFDLRCVHSRKLALPSVRRCDPSNPVPLSGFLTPSAVCSTSVLRVCCAPLPAMGSVAFPGVRPIVSVEMGTNVSVPRAADNPTKSSPRQQPCRITAVVASLPLPSVLPVSPTRFPGLSKYVANKFVGGFRRTEPACAVPCGPSPFRGRRAGVDPRRPKPPGFPEVAA